MPGVNVPAVKVNTVGYPASWRKLAILNFTPDKPALIDEAGKRVFEISGIKAFGLDDASKDQVWQADFSAFKSPGTYRIQNGKDRSDPFVIGDKVYAKAADAALKMFYFQRCGEALKEPATLWGGNDDPNGYERPLACHLAQVPVFELNRHPEQVPVKDAPTGGWHDAGNYDMYVPSTAPSAMLLLNAASGSQAILAEAKVGVDWVAKMMQPDGSARARLGIYRQGDSNGGTASSDRAPRWLSGPGTASTAKACALLALASKAYPGDKNALATKAKAAWKFLQKHPERIFADNHGSDQPLWDDAPEYPETSARALAAAEMHASFKEAGALAYLQKVWSDPELMPAKISKGAWCNVGRFVMMRVAQEASFPAEMRAEAKRRILDCVAPWREAVEAKDGYRCGILPGDYYWGSNSNLLETAQLMLVAARLDPANFAWAKEAARDQWHWILGRNPNGFSMVSRIGRGPDRIYHLEWGKKKVPVPGYLIDGPNFANGAFLSPSAPAKALLWDNPAPLARSGLPAHALWHNEQEDLWDGGFVPENQWSTGWWVVMEPDIYYNANLVAVAAEMQD